MNTSIVKYKDSEYDVTFTVRQATVMDGLTRSVHLAEAYTEPQDDDTSMVKRLQRIMIIHTLPACLAVTTVENSAEALKKLDLDALTHEDFLQLPEEMVFHWERAVFKLNPHWEVQAPTSEEEAAQGEKNEPGDSGN